MAKTIGHAAEGGTLLVHVDEDLAQRAVLVFPGADIELVDCRCAPSACNRRGVGQAAAAGDVAVYDLLGDAHRLGLGFLGKRLVQGIQHGVERLAELGAVPVQGVGLEHQPPAQRVSALHVFHRRRMRHVDGLGNRPGDKRLGGGHHADVRLGRQVALAQLAALVGAVEYRVILHFQVWRSFDRHGTAHVIVGQVDLLLGKADRSEQIETRSGKTVLA